MPDDPTPDAPGDTPDQPDPTPPAATDTPEPDTGTDPEVAKWKALARKHEQQAKANAEAAKRLKEIEDAEKSESQKLAEALEEAKQDAATKGTELARLRAAIKHGLSEDDLDLLGDGTPDEIEARAARLAQRLGGTDSGKRPVKSLGTKTDPPVDADTWLRDLARG